MVGIVKPKPFKVKKRKKKKYRSNTEKKSINIKIKSKFLINIIWFFIFILVFVYGTGHILKLTIFSPKYLIKEVQYAKDSVEIYDDPYLYSIITNLLKDENYYIIRYIKHKKIISTIKNKYPIIKDIKIVYNGYNKAVVEVSFFDPQIVFFNATNKFAIYNDSILDLYSGNLLGKDSKKVLLPEYLSGLDNIDGIFYEINSYKIIEQIDDIYKTFSDLIDVIYFPGAKKYIIDLSNHIRLYISNNKNIENQIDYYNKLKKNYDKFSEIKAIDLGSLSDNKIIIKK